MTRARRHEAVLRAVQGSGRPYYIVCREIGLSPSTITAWRDYGILPKRADARMRLAAFLQLPLEVLEYGTECETHEPA